MRPPRRMGHQRSTPCGTGAGSVRPQVHERSWIRWLMYSYVFVQSWRAYFSDIFIISPWFNSWLQVVPLWACALLSQVGPIHWICGKGSRLLLVLLWRVSITTMVRQCGLRGDEVQAGSCHSRALSQAMVLWKQAQPYKAWIQRYVLVSVDGREYNPSSRSPLRNFIRHRDPMHLDCSSLKRECQKCVHLE